MHCIQYGLITVIFFCLSFLYTWILLPSAMVPNTKVRIVKKPAFGNVSTDKNFTVRTVFRQVVSTSHSKGKYKLGSYVDKRQRSKERYERSVMCTKATRLANRLSHNSKIRQNLLDYYLPEFILAQEHLCQPSEDVPNGLFLLVQVHSHPAHKERRDAIRATWGSVVRNFNTQLHIGLVFLVGLSNTSHEINSAVFREAKLYRDIVQGNFTDTYRNLTIKSIMGLHWTSTFCCNTRYTMKTDDDVYFNISLLMSFLQSLPKQGVLVGSIYEDSQVMREGQWQVKLIDFPFSVYPPYCAGAAYVMSPDVSRLLLSTFITKMPKPLLTIEDAYVTGFLANDAKLNCSHSDLFPNWMSTPSVKTFRNFFHRKVFAIHGVPFAAMYQIEKLIRLCKDCASNMSTLKDWFIWIGRNSTFGT